jgi:probable HAF family extracellular repeat protein
MNNFGEIVGTCNSRSHYFEQPYYWDRNLKPHALPVLGGYMSLMTPLSINDHSEVVGLVLPGRDRRFGFLYTPRKGTQALGRDSAAASAQAINNDGKVVGYLRPRGDKSLEPYAAAWTSDGGLESLAPDPIAGVRNTAASAINDRGQILVDVNATVFGGRSTALLQPDGSYQPLPGARAKGEVVGLALSSDGKVAGRRYRPNQHAFYWNGGRMIDLGTLSGMSNELMSIAYGVNSSGQVVGYSDVVIGDHATAGAAFYWDERHGMLNLENMIDPSDELSGTIYISGAYAINDKGWILVQGGKTGDFFYGSRPMILVPASH